MSANQSYTVTVNADPAVAEALQRATEEARLAREVLESKLALLAETAQLFVKSLKCAQ